MLSEGRSEHLQTNDFDEQCRNLPPKSSIQNLGLKDLTACGCLCFQRAEQRSECLPPLCPARVSRAEVQAARTAAHKGARVGAQNGTEHSRMGRWGSG